MKVTLLFLIIIFSTASYAKEIYPFKLGVSFAFENVSIETKETAETNKATTSFFSSQIVPSVGFFSFPYLLIGAQYTQSVMGEFSVNGVGLFTRYYFIGGATKILKVDENEFKLDPSFSIYAGGAYKNLLIGAGDFDIRFNVFEVSAGMEKYISKNLYIYASTSLSHLSSSSSRVGLGVGASFGIGHNY